MRYPVCWTLSVVYHHLIYRHYFYFLLQSLHVNTMGNLKKLCVSRFSFFFIKLSLWYVTLISRAATASKAPQGSQGKKLNKLLSWNNFALTDQLRWYSFSVSIKVNKFQNENMKSSHCPKYERKNLKNSALSIQGRIFQIFRSYFGQSDNIIFSFRNFLTFRFPYVCRNHIPQYENRNVQNFFWCDQHVEY